MNPLPRFRKFILLLAVLLAVFRWDLQAQDPAVMNINGPMSPVFANQSTPIAMTVANLSTMPAFNVQVMAQVLDINNQPVFMWQTNLPVIGPFQFLTLSTLPNEWVPNPPGGYIIIVNVFAPGDTNPGNNNMTKPIQAVPQYPIEIRQMDLVNPFPIPNSTYGALTITYPPLPNPLFVNVMANDPNGTDVGWVIQNMPILPFVDVQTMTFWFDLRLVGFEEGENVPTLNYSMRLDPVSRPGPFPVFEWNTVTVGNRKYNTAGNNPLTTVPSTPAPVPTLPTFGANTVTDSLNRGCTVPNIDLDSTTHKPTPTYAGDWNACGPASAANSLQWLEDTHPNIPANGQTHRQKMQSLSGHMGRADTSGVTTEQLVKGKLGYIDEHKLPIHVKYQSVDITAPKINSPDPRYGHSAENKGGTGANGTWPTFDFIKSELKKGEDVEILFGWYDSAGNRHGGHWVVLTGFAETPDAKRIYMKDDEDQEGPGGTGEFGHGWVTDGDRSRLTGFDGPNNYCWVESVVSESYDPTITFKASKFKINSVGGTQNSVVALDPHQTLFSFDFPPGPDTGYFNMLMSLPDSADYWVGRNVLLPPRDTIETVSLWIDLADIGLLPNQTTDSVKIKVGVSPDFSVDSFFDVFYTLTLDVGVMPYIVGDGALGLDTIAVFPIPLPPTPYDPALPATFVYRGCEMPNVDLDSTANNPVTCPGYAGDKNACGPAAAANSLQWLEDTHPLIPSSGTDLREKLKELSEMMDRANNGGVLRKDFIEAKLEFIDKYKLPIHVKFQGFYFDANNIASPDTNYNHSAQNHNDTAFAKAQWDWLVQEMENGEDVELEFGYYDNMGIRRGGHWITVTGVTEIGGVRTVYFKDDTDQKMPDGMRHQCTEWKGHPSGHSYLKDLSGNGYTCWVESVVSESYDPTITFCPTTLVLTGDPIAAGTYSADQTILVSGKIASGSNVILSAPNIQLNGIFEIEQGATLATNTTGCDQ